VELKLEALLEVKELLIVQDQPQPTVFCLEPLTPLFPLQNTTDGLLLLDSRSALELALQSTPMDLTLEEVLVELLFPSYPKEPERLLQALLL